MPAFTFEKIAPPARATASLSQRASLPPQSSSRQTSVGKSRTLISSMLDRFAIARLKREEIKLPSTLPRKPPPD